MQNVFVSCIKCALFAFWICSGLSCQFNPQLPSNIRLMSISQYFFSSFISFMLHIVYDIILMWHTAFSDMLFTPSSCVFLLSFRVGIWIKPNRTLSRTGVPHLFREFQHHSSFPGPSGYWRCRVLIAAGSTNWVHLRVVRAKRSRFAGTHWHYGNLAANNWPWWNCHHQKVKQRCLESDKS